MEWMLGGVIQANRLHQSGVMWSVRSLQDQYEEYKKTAGEFLGEAHTNDYALYHARAIYEGQRARAEKGWIQ